MNERGGERWKMRRLGQGVSSRTLPEQSTSFRTDSRGVALSSGVTSGR